MSSFYFSPSSFSFYPAAWKDDGTYNEDTWPQDAILLTDEEVSTFYGQNPPIGKTMGAVDGRPAWVDIPPVIIPLPEMKESKRAEMREACFDEITRSSYQSDALGAVHNYDCRVVDQLNLSIRYSVAQATSGSEPIWASDGTRYQWVDHTATEIIGVMKDMNEHIKAAQVNLATKLAAVDAATTAEQVSAIQW